MKEPLGKLHGLNRAGVGFVVAFLVLIGCGFWLVFFKLRSQKSHGFEKKFKREKLF